MSATKHTPGPWEARPSGLIVTVNGNVRFIARVEIHETSANIDEVDEANAQLIAAAPDLLDVCNSILSHFAGTHEDNIALPLGWGRYQQLRTAIAKAEGQQ